MATTTTTVMLKDSTYVIVDNAEGRISAEWRRTGDNALLAHLTPEGVRALVKGAYPDSVVT